MTLVSDIPVAASHGPTPPARRRVGNLLTALPMLVAALLGLIATTWIGLYTERGQLYDERALRVLDGNGTGINDRLVGLLDEISLVSAVVALVAVLTVALVRGRFRLGFAAAVLVVGANVTTQLLKHFVLTRPDLGQGSVNSLPSGHTTVVFSLVLAAVLVSPRALRWVVALLGSAVGGLTGLATVIAGWHRPSDVVAALLVTAAWAALVSAVVAGRPRDGVRGRTGMFPAIFGGGLAAIGVIIYGFGWSAGDDVSSVIPFTALVIAGASALAVGGYTSLVSRTSN